MIEVSKNQLERLTADWTRAAKEEITTEYIKGTIYAFGSELACLRLYAYYNGSKDCKAAYSTNRGTWYFRLELSI